MLVDFPEVKREISNILLKIFNQASGMELGPFRDIGRKLQHEGNKGSYSTMQGVVKKQDFQKMEVKYQIKYSDVPNMTFKDVIDLVQRKGKDMGTQMGKYFFSTVNKAIDETGNTIDARGQPFSLELMFKVLEKMEIPFDEDGNPHLPKVVHPKTMKKLKEAIEKEKAEKKFEKRHKLLIERKRKEWNEKQSNRKLVD